MQCSEPSLLSTTSFFFLVEYSFPIWSILHRFFFQYDSYLSHQKIIAIPSTFPTYWASDSDHYSINFVLILSLFFTCHSGLQLPIIPPSLSHVILQHFLPPPAIPSIFSPLNPDFASSMNRFIIFYPRALHCPIHLCCSAPQCIYSYTWPATKLSPFSSYTEHDQI